MIGTYIPQIDRPLMLPEPDLSDLNTQDHSTGYSGQKAGLTYLIQDQDGEAHMASEDSGHPLSTQIQLIAVFFIVAIVALILIEAFH